MIVSVPWPSKLLSPNSRAHWAPKAREKRKARSDAAWLTIAAPGFRDAQEAMQDELPIPVSITFHPPDARKRDLDNALASSKAMLDGIAEALGVDDSRFVLTIKMGDARKPGSVEVEL